jgi:hypothetical protein
MSIAIGCEADVSKQQTLYKHISVTQFRNWGILVVFEGGFKAILAQYRPLFLSFRRHGYFFNSLKKNPAKAC